MDLDAELHAAERYVAALRAAAEARQALIGAGRPPIPAEAMLPAGGRACQECGTRFETTNPRRLYCSDRCRIRYNSRQQARRRRSNGTDPMTTIREWTHGPTT
jgi:hypothetical protein